MNYQQTFEQEILAYAQKHGPKEWHSIATNWTYIFGNEPIKWIVNQKETYLATALELYWDHRIESFLGIREISADTQDELKLHSEIMELIEVNIQKPDYYQDTFYSFEYKPDRYDLSKTKHTVPDRLKQSTHTKKDEVYPTYFYEGIPDEVFDQVMKSEIERVEKNPLTNSPKYWVFGCDSKSYRGQPVNPVVVAAESGTQKITEDKELRELVYGLSPAEKEVNDQYTFTFQIDKRWPTYDVYGSGYGRGGIIYSERTVAIFEKYEVAFKKYPVQFVDLDGSSLPRTPYFLLKLVEPPLNALNEEESLFVGSYQVGVKRIILDGEKTKNAPLFLLLKMFVSLMRDDIVQEMLEQKITGWWFVEAEKWHSGKFGDSFMDGSATIT